MDTSRVEANLITVELLLALQALVHSHTRVSAVLLRGPHFMNGY